MLPPMDGDRSGGRLGACIEGAVLLGMLGALGLGLLAVHTDGGIREGGGSREEGGDDGSVVVVDGRGAVHLVILVDVGEPLASAVEFSRALDSGAGWMASVEVVEATDTMVLGLQEALLASGAPCGEAGCVELVVLDLRVRGA